MQVDSPLTSPGQGQGRIVPAVRRRSFPQRRSLQRLRRLQGSRRSARRGPLSGLFGGGGPSSAPPQRMAVFCARSGRPLAGASVTAASQRQVAWNASQLLNTGPPGAGGSGIEKIWSADPRWIRVLRTKRKGEAQETKKQTITVTPPCRTLVAGTTSHVKTALQNTPSTVA
jgi:hypothetical protein